MLVNERLPSKTTKIKTKNSNAGKRKPTIEIMIITAKFTELDCL